MAVMNKHKVDIVSEVSMPKRGDSLDNPLGHPKEFKLPTMEVVPGKYTNTLYSPRDITDDWKAYKDYLSEVKPAFHPHVLFVGHDFLVR